MKKILKKFLHPYLWDIIRYFKFRIFKLNNFAPYNLDKILEKYINYKYGYFVELGANDGYTESATLSLEIKKLWRGILIEPNPSQFLTCTYYRNKPGNHLYCNACVPFSFKKNFVKIEYANLMSVSSGLDSDLNNITKHLISGRSHLLNTHQNISFGAVPMTLNKILDLSDAPKIIDFLSLDVEGAEYAVLNGIDFNKYKFKYIMIECRNFKKIKSFLKKKNYYVIEKLTHHDYLFTSEK